MKTIKSINYIYLINIVFLLLSLNVYSRNRDNYTPMSSFVIEQIPLDANNINTWIINTGIFNQDLRVNNTPGFEWPRGAGSFAIFTTGLSTAAYIDNVVTEAMCSYKGEYEPGYILDTEGMPLPLTDSRFKIYSVYTSNPNTYDWMHWGDMVPFGAPYTDINHNGIYEPSIDMPGVTGASQTIFVCLTDGFPETHQVGEGFGGGTSPLFAEVHMLCWSYNSTGLEDVNFIKWDIINKGNKPWNNAFFSIICDPDLGCPNDDFIGSDTSLSLGYCYNGVNSDCSYQYRYPGIVPAVGITLLKGAVNKHISPNYSLNMTSFNYFVNTSTPSADCEHDPNGEQIPAFYLMQGIKKDQTPWVVPPGGSENYVTKFCYPGDPYADTGWCEADGNPTGSVWNCGGPGIYTGPLYAPNLAGDRRFIIGTGSDNLMIDTGETQTIVIAQMIAQGTSRKHSIYKLKQLCSNVRDFYLIGVNPISKEVPKDFYLFQNYPNPFNPTTNIKYQITKTSIVKITVYDILGKEIVTLVNEKENSGIYEIQWNAVNFPSGVYFYKLTSNDFTETKKMVLLK